MHFAGVIDRLGIRDAVAARLRPYANGATAMAELATSSDARPIGCTQATEILYTPGVRLVGPLPGDLALVTTYAVAVTTDAPSSALARRLAASLAGDGSAPLRRAAGFEAIA
jgi:molybdate transport system substrate-binding protein